jgi:branched-chain amino acid transport system ATP-binding protein
MADGATLSISRVTKRYAGVTALNSISLTVRPGEILGLLGANGAGKTTLLDIVGGEQTPDEGTVTLGGRTLTGPPYSRARLGLSRTFQHPKVSGELSVLENVAVGLAVSQLSGFAMTWSMLWAVVGGKASYRTRAREACEEVGLRSLERPAQLLSFGELRLLEVARALVQKPQMLLLDEPFPGVEDDGIARLAAAIQKAASAHRSVVLVDHNISLVEGLVGRVVLLARGEIAFEGSVRDCLASPAFQEEYVGVRRK